MPPSSACSKRARSTTGGWPAPTRGQQSTSKDAAGFACCTSSTRRASPATSLPRLADVFGDLDERTLVDRALQKKLRRRPQPVNPAELARLYQHLMRQGFSPGRWPTRCASCEKGDLQLSVMRSREIRSSFLEYFRRHGHTIVPSSPLVPHDDPTLLFTNAGMNQFKDVFLGPGEAPLHAGGDLAEVHARQRQAQRSRQRRPVAPASHVLRDAGQLFLRRLLQEGGDSASPGSCSRRSGDLPGDRLFPTIFKGESGIPRDDEAYEIWTKVVPADRITELGLAENFWSMGDTGPCGRCSEIHYFRGNEAPCEEERRGTDCRGLDCSCDRYVEVWNNVFMEFDRQPDGRLNPLPAPSIDTGMGLERITAVIQGKLSNYDTDLFTPILDAIAARAGRRYTATLDDASDVSMRVIADHLRAMTFLIADGVMPSNEHRGYVLRKIMRRAMRHGKRLGFSEPVLHALVDVVVKEMGDAYPELKSGRDAIVRVVRSEEERFDAVLTAGLPRLEDALDRAEAGNGVLSGDEAFRLYDSLGVPLDFMEDLADQRRLSVDRAAFERAMEGQREKARAGSTFKGGEKGLIFTMTPDIERALDSAGDQFAGYESTIVQGVPIIALFDQSGVPVERLSTGTQGYVALGRTPFYLEAGGQVSDSGRILGARRLRRRRRAAGAPDERASPPAFREGRERQLPKGSDRHGGSHR